MKKIFDKDKIESYIQTSKYRDVLSELDVEFCLLQYEKGELVASPFENELLFKIAEQGLIDVYFIRDDGSRYSLSNGKNDHFLGDMDLFYPRNNNIFAQAAEDLTCISFSIEKSREYLLADNQFLRLMCSSLSAKIIAITTIEAEPASLKDRVISYIKYNCEAETLKGIEQSAFHLHCSARQLQRILNQCECEGVVLKTGKGTYRLI